MFLTLTSFADNFLSLSLSFFLSYFDNVLSARLQQGKKQSRCDKIYKKEGNVIWINDDQNMKQREADYIIQLSWMKL